MKEKNHINVTNVKSHHKSVFSSLEEVESWFLAVTTLVFNQDDSPASHPTSTATF